MKLKIVMCSALAMAMILSGCSKATQDSGSSTSVPTSAPESSVSTSESATSESTSESTASESGSGSTSEVGSEVVDEKPEGDKTDKEYLETFGIDRNLEKQAVIDELTTKYPSESFNSLSTARMIYQLGWDPLHKVNFAGALAPDASCIVYLEFDASQKEYAQTSLGNYVNWLKTALVEECETELDTLRLNSVTYEVRDTSALFIFPGAWMRDPAIDEVPEDAEDVESEVTSEPAEEAKEYTEYEMYEYGISYAIDDIKASLGF